jgi:MFS family permease
VLDFSLLALPTFQASFVGGFLFRIGIGAMPFLLPLMLQLAFGLSPFQSGLITFSAAVGALTMKTFAAMILKRFGFRTVLVANALLAAIFVAACAKFTVTMPFAVMITVLLVGGFFRSLQFTSVNAIAYAEVPPPRMSRATSLAAVGQQVSLSTGVAVGGLAVELAARMRGDAVLTEADFMPAFLIVAAISAASALVFARLPADAGAEMADRTPVPTETSDQRVG